MSGGLRKIDQEFKVPVSAQGQITLPKSLRDSMKIPTKGGYVTILRFNDGSTEIQPKYSVADVAGFFKQAATAEAPDINKCRDIILQERFKELGYDQKNS